MAYMYVPWYNTIMKKLMLTIMCALLIFSCGAAYADETEPTPTPVPTPSPNPVIPPNTAEPEPFNGLISLSANQGGTDEDVVRVQIRLRDLCYFSFKPTGKYQSMTANAAKAFQLKHTTDDGTAMLSDGTIGAQTMDILFRHNVSRSDIQASIPIGTSSVIDNPTTGEAVAWEEVRSTLAIGSSYLITDYNTGTTFYMVFTGGENHAEMECKDAFNAGVLKGIFGGEFNFSKRAVTVSVNGKNIAASLQGYPHGEDTYGANDMSGHVCLFFDGSLSHVGSLPDAEHQELVYKASGRG